MSFSSSYPLLHFLPASDPPYKLLQTHPSFPLLTKCKNIQSFKQVHSQFIKFGLHNVQFALSKLVEFCAISPFGDLSYALSIFNSIDDPNHVIYNMIIRGLALSSSSNVALDFYVKMLLSGLLPNSYTFPFVFKCCAKMMESCIGKQIHGHVLKFGLDNDVYVHTSIINMYAQVGELDSARLVFDKGDFTDAVSFTALINGYASKGRLSDARELFDKIPVKDVVSWNAMISGFAQIGMFEEALDLFKEMRSTNIAPDVSTLLSVLSACAHMGALELGNWVYSWIKDHSLGTNIRLLNALIDMYAKCNELKVAKGLFDSIQEKDLITWNVMIGGYTHVSEFKQALTIFRQMQIEKVEPNDITFLSILPACAHLGALHLGKWIHAYINKHNHKFTNPSLYTSLINMYAKCGNIEAAKQVFNEMETITLASWNVMISALSMHGNAHEALNLFDEMSEKGFIPDDITFVSVLSACSHAGLVYYGRECFNLMIHKFNIQPKLQHYGCMIDLLGRAGLFDEAMELINTMEINPDGAIWGSLLGACRIHGNIELGELVAGNLFKVEPNNPGAYVLLSNMYARVGKWDDVARIRTMINDKGMKKVPGCTSIEVDSIVHEFVVSDRTHPETEGIYKMLNEIDMLLSINGHVIDTSEVLYDIDEEVKEGKVCEHSEKLAIAFGLISTKRGTTLRIVKNLRVCGNCHEATKLISKIFDRDIIARDRNRFHHFKNGFCSCNDYW